MIVHGNMLHELAKMEPNSVDSVTTDPPYELGFMGKSWDSSGVAFNPATWAAALRVAKPGAHLVAFGGSRTYHRIACAIEDAGWQLRDSLMWLYGTGFPKSLDVSKAIDKARPLDPAVRVVCRHVRACMDRDGVTAKRIAGVFGFHSRMVDHWAARDSDSQPTTPTVEQWEKLKKVLNVGYALDFEVARLNGEKGEPGEDWHKRESTKTHAAAVSRDTCGFTATAGPGIAAKDIAATDLALQWDGWGTALKPAFEPIVLARKPLDGTVARNVLEYGTGGLNIDGCRVPRDDKPENGWPANVILDEGAGAALDAQTGKETSRFFYCAKASRSEREAGLDHMPLAPPGELTGGRAEGSKGLDSPRAGAGRGSGRRNTHPTVKPIELMRYLVRLVTPPGGLVLDPFAGSGTTGAAAVLEGFRFIGFDLDEKHCEIARGRIAHWAATVDPWSTAALGW